MPYKEFLESVIAGLTQRLGETCSLTLRPLPKNNGVELDGLTIQGPQHALAPTVHITPYYEAYLKGRSIDEILDEILSLYQATPRPDAFSEEDLMCFGRLKDRIFFRLVHTQSNRVLLSDLPHLPYLDLSIIFYLSLKRTSEGQMTALIHNAQLKRWDTDVRELWRLALVNTQRDFPPVFMSMRSALSTVTAAPETAAPAPQSPIEDYLHILTNPTGFCGAASLLYPGIIDLIAERLGHDLFLLPSSIHEILVVPDDGRISAGVLADSVLSVNETEVDVEERLSNQVYHFCRESGQLQIISENRTLLCDMPA